MDPENPVGSILQDSSDADLLDLSQRFRRVERRGQPIPQRIGGAGVGHVGAEVPREGRQK